MTACRTSPMSQCTVASAVPWQAVVIANSGPSWFPFICLLPPCHGFGFLLLSCKVLFVRRSGCTSTTRAARLSVEAKLYAARVMAPASASASASMSSLGTTRGRFGSIWACPICPDLYLRTSTGYNMMHKQSLRHEQRADLSWLSCLAVYQPVKGCAWCEDASCTAAVASQNWGCSQRIESGV